MRKIVIRILTVIAVIAMLIIGKIQMDKYRVKSIAHSEEAKVAIENMLKIMDEKALTPEGKIKSYKIDDNYTERNPMGGVNISIVVNDDKEMMINTTLEKYLSSEKYEINSKAVSPKLSQELRGNNEK
ncbi:DUF1310 family protein [Gemella morbillorum]|uniref:DUF1310 family protein n=1 Tax=Gemella morbillorum TaxID=29391 RepID=UPI0028D1411B|nr:DUF1310 family protein [Gemella morbillorum]